MEEIGYRTPEKGTINWLEYLPVLWKFRLLIGSFFLVSVLYALVLAYLAPRFYEATATIIKVNAGGDGGNLLSMLAQQVGIGGGGSSPGRGDQALVILKSRTMAEEMVKQLKLEGYYGASRLQDAAASLMGATTITPSRNGPIEIKVRDRNPQKAAEIANTYPGILNRHLNRMGAGLSTIQRQFIEGRLKETDTALRNAEEALKTFQEKNRAILPVQVGEAIGAAASLRAQLIGTEIQLQQFRAFATESNPEIIKLKRAIAELKRQIAQAQYGSNIELPSVTPQRGDTQKELYVPAAKVPEMTMEFTRLTRDVKVQEGVFSLLTQQLEQAKIFEAQDAPLVQILDAALPPGNPVPLNTARSMAIYGFLGIFAGAAVAVALDFLARNWLTVRSLMPNMGHRQREANS